MAKDLAAKLKKCLELRRQAHPDSHHEQAPLLQQQHLHQQYVTQEKQIHLISQVSCTSNIPDFHLESHGAAVPHPSCFRPSVEKLSTAENHYAPKISMVSTRRTVKEHLPCEDGHGLASASLKMNRYPTRSQHQKLDSNGLGFSSRQNSLQDVSRTSVQQDTASYDRGEMKSSLSQQDGSFGVRQNKKRKLQQHPPSPTTEESPLRKFENLTKKVCQDVSSVTGKGKHSLKDACKGQNCDAVVLQSPDLSCIKKQNHNEHQNAMVEQKNGYEGQIPNNDFEKVRTRSQKQKQDALCSISEKDQNGLKIHNQHTEKNLEDVNKITSIGAKKGLIVYSPPIKTEHAKGLTDNHSGLGNQAQKQKPKELTMVSGGKHGRPEKRQVVFKRPMTRLAVQGLETHQVTKKTMKKENVKRKKNDEKWIPKKITTKQDLQNNTKEKESLNSNKKEKESLQSNTKDKASDSSTNTFQEIISQSYNPCIATRKPLLEVFEAGAWLDVEVVGLEKANLLVHFVGYGKEKQISCDLVRHRSRRAYDEDCVHLLKPGMDVSVYCNHPMASSIRGELAWYDGMIISIHREVHAPSCFCQFDVQLYNTDDLELRTPSRRSLLPEIITCLTIDRISILQKFCIQDLEIFGSENTPGQVKQIWSADSMCLPESISLTKKHGCSSNVIHAFEESHRVNKEMSCDSLMSFQKPGGMEARVERTLEFEVDTVGIDQFKLLESQSSNDPCEQLGENQVLPRYIESPKEKVNESVKKDSKRKQKPDSTHKIRNGPYPSHTSAEQSNGVHIRTSGKLLEYKVLTTRGRKQKHECELQKRVQALLSRVTTVISMKKKHWQRKLSILVSGVSHSKQMLPVKAKLRRSRFEKKRQVTNTVRSTGRLILNAKGSFNTVLKLKCSAKTASTKLNWSKTNIRRLPILCHEIQPATSKKKKLSFGKVRKKGTSKKHEEDSKENQPATSKKRRLSCGKLKKKETSKKHRKDSKGIFDVPRTILDELLILPIWSNRHLVSDWSRLPSKSRMDNDDLPVPWDPNVFHESPMDSEDNVSPENDPFEHLWQDMEFSSTRETVIVKPEVGNTTRKGIWTCEGEHNFFLNEDVGLVCQTCGLVECNIEDLMPPLESKKASKNYHEENEDGEAKFAELEDILNYDKSDEQFSSPVAKPCNRALNEIQSSVWDLIPELRERMHPHQRDGFEFLWRNIVGSIGPDSTVKPGLETGGCIISHAPGTGKTFLIISFLYSYMQLHPNSRPLILAPTSMLRAWQREFEKWKIKIPVLVLNTSENSQRKAVDTDNAKIISVSSKASSKTLVHMHRIQTISQWHKEECVLVVSYRLFVRLTDEDNPRLSAFSRDIGRLLVQRPGLVVLDEGHVARNNDAKIHKCVMHIQTPLRIFLSGTLFQNNCSELFNSFHLVRPTFMKDVLESEGNRIMSGVFKRSRGSRPKWSKPSVKIKPRVVDSNNEKECIDESILLSPGTWNELEARSRKVFMEIIGRTLENGQHQNGNVLEMAIKRLRTMIGSFVHLYNGDVLKSLPGLKDFTVFLKVYPVQEKIINEFTEKWSKPKDFEFKYIISSICIHPYLFKSLSSKEYCDKVNGIEELVKNPDEGVKIKFVLDLLWLCRQRNEKMLVFSQNIIPLDFLEELLKSDFDLLKGESVLKLHGQLPLDDRQRIIDQFNKPDGCARVLLVSMKACSEGISLTGASRVVFLDIVWNPAVIKQAISRAFRLGQSRHVFVYRLIASGTMEEEKYRRIIWKDWLSRTIFESPLDGNRQNACDKDTSTPTKYTTGLKNKEMQQHISFEEDDILGTILENDRQLGRIVRIKKHDSFLDQGNIVCNDDDDDADNDNDDGEQEYSEAT